MSRAAVLSRRRRALITLIALSVATMAMAGFSRNLWMLGLHSIVGAVLIWFVVMLRRIREHQEAARRLMEEQEEQVVYRPMVTVVP